MNNYLYKFILSAALFCVYFSVAATPVSDVANTKHNLSATGAGVVKATSEDQICVFCHTPHAATTSAAPLWNKELSTADGAYTLYSSDSIDAVLEQPGGSSKLCLSCHDGAMMIGKVNVLNGVANSTIAMSGTAGDGTMPAGDGATTGFTRDLGVDLSNDHPISFDFTTALDSEIYDPTAVGHIDNRVSGVSPTIPLENNQVQCISCHDPHVKDSAGENIKFLRLNRTQKVASPTDGTFNSTNDIICLGCHKKSGWSNSAHANSQADVANETYTSAAATQREFTTGIKVWEAACLNCHDTHTIEGARKLLREGTDSATSPKAGGNPALEETCYQCHSSNGGLSNDGGVLTSQGTAGFAVPNVETDFQSTYAMPIDNVTEVHSISDENFNETTTLLGKGNLGNRHAECTDCHNPHRVKKNRLFNADASTPDAAGTHTHDYGHTNIASGVLAGTTGVEPVYGSTAWGSIPTSYTLKSGMPTTGGSTATASSYVTREYQVCLKCHSDNAWNTAPLTGPSIGLNGVAQYTDQAMEFQSPVGDQGEAVGGSVGAAANHRSWHPVMNNTGRSAVIRAGMSDTNFITPWNDTSGTNVGNQTMYCSDCHGSDTGIGSQTVVPGDGTENSDPWGPHGSSNPFILKGSWDTSALVPGGNELCFKCHSYDAYSNVANATDTNVVNFKSGFSSANTTASGAMGCTITTIQDQNNLHLGHRGKIGADLRCSWCHAAVPHGWKNKALLVDITTDSVCAGVEPCNDAPYFQNAMLGGGGVVNWKPSGYWQDTDCGGANGVASWMGGTCNAPP